MRPVRVLLVEDDAIDRMAFKRLVREYGLPYEYKDAASVAEAKELIKKEFFDVILTDYLLGDGDAFEILQMNPESPVIIITGAGSEEIAVRAMKAGAYDYLIKDSERNYLKVLPIEIEKAIKHTRTEQKCRLLSERETEEAELAAGGGISDALKLVNLAAMADSPVLITGETGTGKTLFARAIHYKGASPWAPFVSVNCSALPETLIEAELFGYEKGAFTGAGSSKKGYFELAEGGTLFLDEIGEMPLHLQSKLLSAIEEKTIRRLGSEFARPINVRIIAATSINIEAELGKTFRSDLYYRLSVIRIHIPPLRERRQDIPELCQLLLRKITGGEKVVIDESEMKKLMDYDWPGNVRDLRNVLERAFILQGGPVLRPSEFIPTTKSVPATNPAEINEKILTLYEMEKSYIQSTLKKLSGNYSRTARALGISLSTLKRKLKQYQIRP